MHRHGLPFTALAAVALAAAGCAPRGAQEQRIAGPVTLEITGSSAASIEQRLAPGHYSVVLEERAIDVRMDVDIRDGRTRTTEDPLPRHGRQVMQFRATRATTVRVTVRGADHSRKAGEVVVSVHGWPAGDETAAAAMRGHAALSAALESYARGGEEGARAAAVAAARGVTAFDDAGRTHERALASYLLAAIRYWRLSEWQQAALDAADARRGFERAGDAHRARQAQVLEAAALMEQAVGSSAATAAQEREALFARADRMLEAAADAFAAAGENLAHAEAVNTRGASLHYQGRPDEAHRVYEQALEAYRAAADPAGESKALANLALLDLERGDARAAVARYEQLHDLLERDRDPELYAELRSNEAVALGFLGESQRALDLYGELLEIFSAHDNQPQRARILQSMGFIHLQAGDHARALELFETVLPLRERYSDGRGVLSALRLSGNAAAALGRLELALERYRRALAHPGTPRDRGLLQVLIAESLRRAGDLEGARLELARALDTKEEIVRAAALLERGRVRLAAGEPQDAVQDLRAAKAAYDALELDSGRIEAATALAQAYLAQRQHASSLAAADQAIRLTEDLRERAANPETRARILAARYEPYEMRIGALLARAGAADREEAAWQALRTAERSRARTLDELLGWSAAGATPDGQQTAGARELLTAKQLQLEARLQRSEAGDERVIELRRDIQEIRARLDAAWRAGSGSDRSPSLERLPDTAAEARRAMPPDALALFYFVGQESSWVWTLSRERLEVAPLPGRPRIAEAASRVAAALRAGERGGLASHAAREAASMLLGPVRAGQGERRLYLLPDGPLNAMPFAALPLPAGPGKGRLLLDEHEITVLPSLSLALADRGERTPAGARRDLVAVVSDPVFAPDDIRLAAVALRSGSGGGQRVATERLARLAYSAAEARRVAAALGRERVISLDGFAATAEQVLQLPFERLGVLHFATHALARPDSPTLSTLHLSAFARNGRPIERSRLTLADILDARMRADLVVLSGCGTADGETLSGEGVIGLTQGFLATGSRAVLATLWPVQDAATAAFMAEFYRRLAVSGDVAGSLRAAQRHARRDERYGRSNVWAAFVLRARSFG